MYGEHHSMKSRAPDEAAVFKPAVINIGHMVAAETSCEHQHQHILSLESLLCFNPIRVQIIALFLR